MSLFRKRITQDDWYSVRYKTSGPGRNPLPMSGMDPKMSKRAQRSRANGRFARAGLRKLGL